MFHGTSVAAALSLHQLDETAKPNPHDHTGRPQIPTCASPRPPGAQCAGGAALKVEPRFWRSNATSPHVYQCQLGRACEGDLEGRCGPGS
jgi:hypothetical protein